MGAVHRVDLPVRLMVSDNDIVHAVTTAGLGIEPGFRCVEDLRVRRLEHVLRDCSALVPCPMR